MTQQDRKFDILLTNALERKPEIHLPPDFAARVMKDLPAHAPRIVRVTHYGRAISTACTLFLIAALVVLGVLYPTSVISLHSNAFLVEAGLTLVLAVLMGCRSLLQTD